MMRILPKETVQRVEAMLAEGRSLIEVARATGIDAVLVREIKAGRHFHQQTPEEQERRSTGGGRDYVPTPEEIAEHCERFRRLALRRSAYRRKFRIPVVSAAHALMTDHSVF